MKIKRFFLISVFIISVVLGASWFAIGISQKIENKTQIAAVEKARVEAEQAPVIIVKTPTVLNMQKPVSQKESASAQTVSQAVGSFNLQVPFVPQAPKKIWDAAHDEYCEEASVLMLVAYYKKQNWSTDEMETKLAEAHAWQVKTFGYFESTTVGETARMARELYGFKKVRVIESPAYEKIRAEVADGKPVIVPANGKALKNPFFRDGGPAYHMLVVRGFTKSGDFITNDPGTKRGENYVYGRDVLMNAIHDWDGGAVASGAPLILVIE